MFYKFVGGTESGLLDIFDKAVVGGSLKFTSALGFNDPFEFKFVSVPPEREVFDAWHAINDPSRNAAELEHGWASFSGNAADWNTNFVPRQNLLRGLYVLCLARRWDSHLMWAHYSSDHRGFAVIYRPELLAAMQKLTNFEGAGDVAYRSQPPELRWFQATREEMIGPIVSTKSEEWAYECEFRAILSGPERRTALYQSVNSDLVAGVILGTRAPCSLVAEALRLQRGRADFVVRQVTSSSRSYVLSANDVEANTIRYGHTL